MVLSRMMASHLHQCFQAISPTVTAPTDADAFATRPRRDLPAKQPAAWSLNLIAMPNGLPANPRPRLVGQVAGAGGECPPQAQKRFKGSASCLPNIGMNVYGVPPSSTPRLPLAALLFPRPGGSRLDSLPSGRFQRERSASSLLCQQWP